MTPPKLSVLISCRKNSKYLAKFLAGLSSLTSHQNEKSITVGVSINDEDTWNNEILTAFTKLFDYKGIILTIVRDQKQLGRAGLHEYFNELHDAVTLYNDRQVADWTIYFCEDHFISMPAWDDYILSEIVKRDLDPNKVYCIIPKFDNVGAMNQILSRGYIEAMGGVIGRHGWIDSYLNDVNMLLPDERIIKLDEETFHDFTHDDPSPMSDSHLQSVIGPKAAELPKYTDPAVRDLVEHDAARLNEAIRKGK